jgi:hypothetical protein
MVLLLILSVVIGIWYTSSREALDDDELADFISNSVRWGNFSPSDNPSKNQCQVYTFPTVQVEYRGIPVYNPPTPTLNPNFLDPLTGSTALPSCIDSDQILAQEVSRTCVGVPYSGPRFPLCKRTDGTWAQAGETEILYVGPQRPPVNPGGCPFISKCPGRLSLISPAFNYSLLSKVCIVKDGDDTKIDYCRPEQRQIFRITRKNPNVSFLTAANPQNDGILGQIYDRESGLYLNGGSGTSSTTFFPSNGEPPVVFNGRTLSWTSDSSYNWIVLPSVQWCTSPTGCIGSSCGLSCSTDGNSSKCIPNESGTSCPIDQVNLIAPPQLVYIAGLDFSSAPILNPDVTTYKNLAGFSALLLWLSDNGATSLYYGGRYPDSGESPILIPIILNNTTPGSLALASQYINLDQYNTLVASAVCVVNVTQPCYPL